jgi:quinol monooxygenase YgiN
MESHAVTVVVRYQALADQAERTERELTELVTTVVAEPGCLDIEIHRDPDDATRLQLLERWADSRIYFGVHMQTPHLRAFMQRAREFLAGPPDISVWRVVGAYGLQRDGEPSARAAV